MGVAVRIATDPGLRRTQNEDRAGVWYAEGAEDGERGVLLVVADGMGGARAGEVASELTVRTVFETFGRAPGDDPTGGLARAVEAANRVVHEHSVEHPDLRGMGTTCTAVFVRGKEAFAAHVGDSRAYLVRDGAIRQLTRDHSLVAQLVQIHQLTPEQARTDPRRNVVTRSVGVGEVVEVDAGRVLNDLSPGDTLLLCSDGLHGLVSDEEMAERAAAVDLDQASLELIELARERGGPDNITVILARIVPAAVAADGG